MKTKKRIINILSFVLLAVFAVSAFCVMPMTAEAAKDDNYTAMEKKYDIAVVFDNSASMYKKEPEYGETDSATWCRAKYAMEIFASMLNYNKDKLHIFPMWAVTTDGSKPASNSNGGSVDAIAITSKADIDKIANLYTVNPGNTPFEPIDEAYEYLNRSNADEKWLIVLTDGQFNQGKRNQFASINLQSELQAKATNGIKVQYLGFDGAATLTPNEANNFYAKKSTDLKTDLIDICNKIFQRSVLPQNRLNGQKLNLDLSMRSIIVFAQGADAKIVSLTNSKGEEIPITLDSGQRKYSEIRAGRYENADIDTSLAGQVVNFGECPKGEYTLNYSGVDADKIEIFYEPNVKIDVALVNSDGEKITEADYLVAGTYTVSSRLIDASTNEEVTNHELLGNNVNLKTYVKTSKSNEPKAYENGAPITLEPDDETQIYVEGEYLGKYKVSTKDDPDWAWIFKGIKIESEDAKFKIEAAVLQSDAQFLSTERDSWQPIKVVYTVAGQYLSDEELAKVNPKITVSGNLKYYYEKISGESAYNVYIAQDENGQQENLEFGTYTLTATGKYVDEYNKEFPEEVKADFEIKWCSVDFNLDAVVLQSGEWYNTRNHDKWEPVRVNLTLAGQPLTDEQLNTVKLSITAPEALKYRYEPIPGKSAYNIYISQNENGEYVKPEVGKYELTINAKYTDAYDKEISSNEEAVSFEIQNYNKIWRILFWILLFLAIFAIWLAFMLQKVLPSRIEKDTASLVTLSSGDLDATSVDVEYRRKGRTISIVGSPAVDYTEQCSATFDIRPVDNHFTPAKSRRIMIVGIDSICEEIQLNGVKYVKYEESWIKATELTRAQNGRETSPIEQTMSCSPRYILSRAQGVATLTCKTKTIK